MMVHHGSWLKDGWGPGWGLGARPQVRGWAWRAPGPRDTGHGDTSHGDAGEQVFVNIKPKWKHGHTFETRIRSQTYGVTSMTTSNIFPANSGSPLLDNNHSLICECNAIWDSWARGETAEDLIETRCPTQEFDLLYALSVRTQQMGISTSNLILESNLG